MSCYNTGCLEKGHFDSAAEIDWCQAITIAESLTKELRMYGRVTQPILKIYMQN